METNNATVQSDTDQSERPCFVSIAWSSSLWQPHSQQHDVAMLIRPWGPKTASRFLHHWTGSKKLIRSECVLRSWKVTVDLLNCICHAHMSQLRRFPVIPSAQRTWLSLYMLGFMVYAPALKHNFVYTYSLYSLYIVSVFVKANVKRPRYAHVQRVRMTMESKNISLSGKCISCAQAHSHTHAGTAS